MTLPLAMFNNLFEGGDFIVLAVLGLLFFGKRLPELGKSLGQTVVQFKKGLKDTTSEINAAGAEEVEEQAPARPQRKLAAPRNRPQPKLLGPVAEEP